VELSLPRAMTPGTQIGRRAKRRVPGFLWLSWGFLGVCEAPGSRLLSGPSGHGDRHLADAFVRERPDQV
jgi:hypothetical protein